MKFIAGNLIIDTGGSLELIAGNTVITLKKRSGEDTGGDTGENPDQGGDTVTAYSATITEIFSNPENYYSTTQDNPVHVVPDAGKTWSAKVDLGSNVIYLDFSAYTTVHVNCSSFTSISDKLYSMTGSSYPWIVGNNNTLTSITINED